MSSSTPRNEPKTGLPSALIALGIVVLMGFSLSVGGLTWWLLARRPASSLTQPAGGLPVPSSTPTANTSAVVEIFNGRDLDGWEFDPVVWDVRQGVIHGSKTRSGSLIWRGGEVEDFELRFRFRLLRGNSGVYYRAHPLPKYAVGGYEFEICTKSDGELSDNGPDRTRRNLFRRDTVEPVDTNWHEVVIIAVGPRLVHQIDGQVFCDVQDTDPAAPRKGSIAFGNAGATTVDFKDIRLTHLKASP